MSRPEWSVKLLWSRVLVREVTTGDLSESRVAEFSPSGRFVRLVRSEVESYTQTVVGWHSLEKIELIEVLPELLNPEGS